MAVLSVVVVVAVASTLVGGSIDTYLGGDLPLPEDNVPAPQAVVGVRPVALEEEGLYPDLMAVQHPGKCEAASEVPVGVAEQGARRCELLEGERGEHRHSVLMPGHLVEILPVGRARISDHQPKDNVVTTCGLLHHHLAPVKKLLL